MQGESSMVLFCSSPRWACVRKRIVLWGGFFHTSLCMTSHAPYYTIGLLGRFEPDETLLSFLEILVKRYDDNGVDMGIQLPLLVRKHNKIAKRLLALKRTFKNFRLELVLDQRQKWGYLNNPISHIGQERNQIIEGADQVYFIEEHYPELIFAQIKQFFASNADIILFASYSEMDYTCLKLPEQPKALLWEAKQMNGSHLKPYSRLFYRSIDFIRNHQFEVLAEDLPDDLLVAWIAEDKKIISRQIGNKSLTYDLLRLLDPQCPLLPVAVFVYAFSFYDNLWSFKSDAYGNIRERFVEFQNLLLALADSRKKGRPISSIDIFDIGHYDSYLAELCLT